MELKRIIAAGLGIILLGSGQLGTAKEKIEDKVTLLLDAEDSNGSCKRSRAKRHVECKQGEYICCFYNASDKDEITGITLYAGKNIQTLHEPKCDAPKSFLSGMVMLRKEEFSRGMHKLRLEVYDKKGNLTSASASFLCK